MGDVTGMKHERWLIARSACTRPMASLQRVDGVRICGLVEANVAVADLEKCKTLLGGLLRLGGAEQPDRLRHAGRYRPKHSGSRPDHAFECVPAADAVVVMFVIRHLLSLSESPKLALQKVELTERPVYSRGGRLKSTDNIGTRLCSDRRAVLRARPKAASEW